MKALLTPSALTLGIACALLASTTVSADVTIKQRVNIDVGGAMSMMSAEGMVTTQIAGERSRSENQVQMKSSMMQRLAKNANTASIVQLDNGKILTLVPEKEQYSEMTFEEMQAQMEASMEQLAELQESGGSLPVSDDECQWSEPSLSVDETRESERFAGVKARKSLITASQTCTVPSSGKQCEMTWNLEFWNAKRMPGDDEAMAFQQAMAEAMGSEDMLSLAQANYAGLLAMFQNGWDEVLEQTDGIEGYPVKTVMSMEIGGEQCTTESGSQIAMDDIWGNAAEAGLRSAGNTAAYHAGAEAGRAAGEAVGGGIGGSIAGSALGSASRELASGMFKSFGKKKREEEAAAAAEAAAANAGMVRIFTVTTELVSVDEDDVPAGRFEVPAGWEKVASPEF